MRFLLAFSKGMLGPSLSRTCPAVLYNWALHAQYATHAHAFLLGFFVTVENKRLVNPTPKRRVMHTLESRQNIALRILMLPKS